MAGPLAQTLLAARIGSALSTAEVGTLSVLVSAARLMFLMGKRFLFLFLEFQVRATSAFRLETGEQV
jgi:hypothetical protein